MTDQKVNLVNRKQTFGTPMYAGSQAFWTSLNIRPDTVSPSRIGLWAQIMCAHINIKHWPA